MRRNERGQMAELKPMEVIMRIDFASSNGTEVVAHAERVQELVRCSECKHYIKHDHRCGKLNHGVKTDFYCGFGERKETEDEHDL